MFNVDADNVDTESSFKFLGYASKIKGVAKALSEKEGIKIIIGGTKASTDGTTIRIPHVKPNLTLDEVDVHIGYINHEVAHVQHSNFDSLTKDIDDLHNNNCKLISRGFAKYIFNSLEDVRVETLRMKGNPGAFFYFTHLNNTLLHAVIKSRQVAAGQYTIKHLINDVILYCTYCYKDELTEHKAWDLAKQHKLFNVMLSEFKPLYKRITDNCLKKDILNEVFVELVAIIERYLEPPKKPNIPKNTQKSSSKEEQDDESDDSDEPDDPQDNPTVPKNEEEDEEKIEEDDSTKDEEVGNEEAESGESSEEYDEDKEDYEETGETSDENKGTIADSSDEDASDEDEDEGANEIDDSDLTDIDEFKNDIIMAASSNLGSEDLDPNTLGRLPTKDELKQKWKSMTCLPAVIQEVRKSASVLKPYLVKSLKGYKSKLTKTGLTEGVLDIKNVHKYLYNKNIKIFKDTKKYKKVNTLLHLLIDCSFSMGESSQIRSYSNKARIIAGAVALACKNTEIEVSIGLFSDDYRPLKLKNTPFDIRMLQDICAISGTNTVKGLLSSVYQMKSSTKDRNILVCITDGEVDEKVAEADMMIRMSSNVEVYYYCVSPLSKSSNNPVNNIPKERLIYVNPLELTNTVLSSISNLFINRKVRHV